ncbi:FXYD domain-containing ion transport regulator 5 isoform X1 [Pongo abelii]
MSPSGRLCLLTIVGLILPTRGQTLKDTTSSSSANSTIMDIQVPTPAPGEERDTSIKILSLQITTATKIPNLDQTREFMDLCNKKVQLIPLMTPRRSLRDHPQAQTSRQTPRPSSHLVFMRMTPFSMMNTPSGNGGCWSQLCCSSQASSSSPVASAGSCPGYAGIIAGESIRNRSRQPTGHPKAKPPASSPCPASCIPSKSLAREGRHRR